MWTKRLTDYLFVTLITLMIWLYAEGRNVQIYQTDSPVSLSIELTADRYRVRGDSIYSVNMAFQGTQVEIDRLKRTMRREGQWTLDVSAVDGAGEKVLDLKRLIARQLEEKKRPVSLVSIEPQTVRLAVDEMVSHDVPLVYQPGGVDLVPNTLKITPPSVQVTLPARVWTTLSAIVSEASTPTLSVQPRRDIKQLAPGQSHEVEADVVLTGLWATEASVRVDPLQVKMKVTTQTRTAVHRLANVPVWVKGAPDMLTKYRVSLSQQGDNGFDSRVIPDVEVTGPAEMIQRVKQGKLAQPVVAVLRLSADELKRAVGQQVTGSVQFEAPNGLTVQSKTTTVRYTVKLAKTE